MEAAAVGRAVEPHQVLAPVGAEVGGQLVAHGLGGHRRSRVLERGEVLAVGRGNLVGQRRLQHAERLAELHRAALELAQGAEELLGGALLHVDEDVVRGLPPEPLAEAHGRTSGVAQGECCDPGRAGRCLARELGHDTSVTTRAMRP